MEEIFLGGYHYYRSIGIRLKTKSFSAFSNWGIVLTDLLYNLLKEMERLLDFLPGELSRSTKIPVWSRCYYALWVDFYPLSSIVISRRWSRNGTWFHNKNTSNYVPSKIVRTIFKACCRYMRGAKQWRNCLKPFRNASNLVQKKE